MDNSTLIACQEQVRRMLRNSQTRVINPIITLGLLREHCRTGQIEFLDRDVRRTYGTALKWMIEFLGHDLHLGAKYYDAYGTRMSRYKVLKSIGHLQYELEPIFAANSKALISWIPGGVRSYIAGKLGIIPSLGTSAGRLKLSEDSELFFATVQSNIGLNPANFEVFSFALLKVHLEKFACRLYRDTTTASHDHGVDVSTNFGVVYQLKKLRVVTIAEAKKIYEELQGNFDQQRFADGKVVLVIDELTQGVKKYLINMRIQPLTTSDLLQLAKGLIDIEDRQKVLRVVHEEFRREYGNRSRER